MFKNFVKNIHRANKSSTDYNIAVLKNSIINTNSQLTKTIDNLRTENNEIIITETDKIIQISIFSHSKQNFQSIWNFIKNINIINNKIFLKSTEEISFSLAITTNNHQKIDYIICYNPEIINYTSSDINKTPDIINFIFTKENCKYKV